MPVVVPQSPPCISPAQRAKTGLPSRFQRTAGSFQDERASASPAPMTSSLKPHKTDGLEDGILWACEDTSVASKMCLVNSIVHDWVLPVLYHSVQFQFSKDITNFVVKHDVPDPRIRSRFKLIRDLYIGRIPGQDGDLLYGSHQWPIPLLQRFIGLCTELRSLTVLYIDQRLWSRFEPLLPLHLEKITLGPMHGSLTPQNLARKPPIRYFTSAYTCLSDEEIEELFKYPTMTRVRKFCEANSMGPAWALNQASLVDKSKNLKEYEIVICGTPDRTEPICLFVEQCLKQTSVANRVVLRQALSGSWVNDVYNEFLHYRRHFIASQ
ncbi:hypothetical protein NP233_g12023 [Leucocoprinus birnbaumii]|uniref:Uncharacterized protein n=1 Tax=Leucocoprinus birnbaumii TaxID=56174 RepID=A0AAD5VFR1_9AGAR|nr:hypothetical protein NP233_g12023 [Leucocoprinus birnbaumii]